MPLDPKHVGRSYGPFTYEVGLEKIREFAVAISALPLPYELARASPEGLRAAYHDEAAGRASRHGSIVAPPTFCVNFNIHPFLRAVFDPTLEVNLAMLLHGEQAFEFLEVVRPGDKLVTRGEIAEIHSKAGKDFLVVAAESRNQHDRPVVRGRWTAIIRQD